VDDLADRLREHRVVLDHQQVRVLLAQRLAVVGRLAPTGAWRRELRV
jgi:hypothetical protein